MTGASTTTDFPFTRDPDTILTGSSPGPEDDLFLSTKTFNSGGTHERSSYVRYDRDVPIGFLDLEATQDMNKRLVAERTVYHDDNGRWTQTEMSSFDGLGHHRVVERTGSFEGSPVKTTTTNYNPGRNYEVDASGNLVGTYQIVLRRKAPQAAVIFDRFHIVRHLNEAVTKVRTQLIRDADPQTRRDLKGTRFPVLKLPESRTPEDRQVLEEQVRGNRKLYRAMLLKDDFMDLYTYQREGWARYFVEGWLRRAMYSKLEPIKKVARMIRNHLEGVLGWVRWRINNGRLEGMNNRIRLLSHRSFGLHSAEALISLVYLCCGGLELKSVHTK